MYHSIKPKYERKEEEPVKTDVMKSYNLPYFAKVYKTYFKDLAAYAVTLRKEIYRVKHCFDYTKEEKEYIVNKKIRPFLFKYKEDIEYGEGLLNNRIEEEY